MAVDPDALVEELREVAARADRLKAKVDRVAGLGSGRVLAVRDDLTRFIDTALRAGPRRRRSYARELDLVAAAVADSQKSEPISPRLFRVVERALLFLKRRDIGRAQLVLRKLDHALEPYRGWREAEEEYESGRNRLEREARELRERERMLAAISRPPRSPDQVREWRESIRDLNRRIEARVSRYLSEYPSRIAVPTLRRLCASTRLRLPRALERASAVLEAVLSEGPAKEAFGDRGLRALVGAASMSEAKLARLLGDPKPFRRAVEDNIRWLRSMANLETFLTVFQEESLAEQVRTRIASTQDFFRELGGSPEVLDALRKAEESVETGEWAANQEADRLYRAHGEHARRARDGDLAEEIRSIRADVARIEDALKRLPAR